MILIEKVLVAFLETVPLVVERVGNRIETNRVEENQKRPVIICQVIDDDAVITHDGASGLRHAIVNLTIDANRYQDVMDLFEAINNQLDGYSGSVAGAYISGAWIESRPSFYGLQSDVQSASLQVNIFYLEE